MVWPLHKDICILIVLKTENAMTQRNETATMKFQPYGRRIQKIFFVKHPTCLVSPNFSINHKLDQSHYFVKCYTEFVTKDK